MQILNPDQSLFASWTYSSTMDSKTKNSGLVQKNYLPWMEDVISEQTIMDQICDSFEIKSTAKTTLISNRSRDLHVQPNPVTDKLCIDLENIWGVWFDMYGQLTGRKILNTKIIETHTEIHPALKSGWTRIEFHSESGFHRLEKILVE